MALGMDMLLDSVFRMAKVNPEEIKSRAVELERTVLEIAVLLRAIYRQNAIMMTQMGVTDNGQRVADESLRICGGTGTRSEPASENGSDGNQIVN